MSNAPKQQAGEDNDSYRRRIAAWEATLAPQIEHLKEEIAQDESDLSKLENPE